MKRFLQRILQEIKVLRSRHNLKKCSSWLWRLLSKSADLSKPWGRFFQILCVSQKVRTLIREWGKERHINNASYSSIFWWEFQARKQTLAPNFDCHHWRQLVSVFLKVPHNLSFFVTISAPFQKWTRTIIASIKRTRAIWPRFYAKY